MTEILATTQYSLFKKIGNNRAINPRHVLMLISSIKRKNLLQYNPIIVDTELRVIDGQHRLEAAKKLNIQIYYVMAKDVSIEDIILLNTHAKTWKITDYLDYYINTGNENYTFIIEFSKKWNVSISNALAMLSVDYDHIHFRAPYRDFKKGRFIVKNLALSTELAYALTQIKPFTLENVSKDRDFIGAILVLLQNEKIDFETFVSRLKMWPQPLFRRGTRREYLIQFENIYNYNAKTKYRFA